jgi:hypothetical protein
MLFSGHGAATAQSCRAAHPAIFMHASCRQGGASAETRRRTLTAEPAALQEFVGQSSESQDKEVTPVEQFLLDILAAIVAGVVVVLIRRKLK